MPRTCGQPYQVELDDIPLVSFEGKGAERELVAVGWVPRRGPGPELARPAPRRAQEQPAAPDAALLAHRLLQ